MKTYEFLIEPLAQDQLRDWIADDRRGALKVMDLFAAIQRDPFTGIGKPEPLKYDRKGCWSRRITQEHRLVYVVTDDTIIIISCKGHYET
jgi:toxin YoeB